MTDSDHPTHDHDARDAHGTAPERPAADSANHVHTHVGATHAHPQHGGAKRPGFLARLFGAPG